MDFSEYPSLFAEEKRLDEAGQKLVHAVKIAMFPDIVKYHRRIIENGLYFPLGAISVTSTEKRQTISDEHAKKRQDAHNERCQQESWLAVNASEQEEYQIVEDKCLQKMKAADEEAQSKTQVERDYMHALRREWKLFILDVESFVECFKLSNFSNMLKIQERVRSGELVLTKEQEAAFMYNFKCHDSKEFDLVKGC
jgi:hypothetical protein